MEWERQLTRELMQRGQSPFLSVIESGIAARLHTFNQASTVSIADKIIAWRNGERPAGW